MIPPAILALLSRFDAEGRIFLSREGAVRRWSELCLPQIAKGNCHIATTYFSAWAEDEQISDVAEAAILFNDGSGHYASLCYETVIDYTARQFSTIAPFPLVLPLEQWEQWIHEKAYLKNNLTSLRMRQGVFLARSPELLRYI